MNSLEQKISNGVKQKILTLSLLVLIVVVVFLAIRFLSGDEDTWLCQNGQWVKHGNPAALEPITPCELDNNQVQPEPLTNITINQPLVDAIISSPVTIKGLARVFENVLQVRIKDASGQVLAENSTMANSQDIGLFGPYQIDLAYNNPQTREGVIEAFQYSAKDGSEIDKVAIAITFADYQTQTVKVYFGNSQQDPAALDCQKVFDVLREIPKTLEVTRASLESLLAGPTDLEKANGYFTSINSGVTINSINLKDGLAYVDFSEELQRAVGGSCRVTHIRSQITETLKQFPTIKEVVISIDGRTEDILQP